MDIIDYERVKEENNINKETAKLLFSPKFIPFYPELLKNWLSMWDCILYWFIDFYLWSNPLWKFYFQNKDLHEILWLSERAISSWIQNLTNGWYIIKKQQTRVGWGTIRYIEMLNGKICHFENAKSAISTINKKYINNIYTNSKNCELGNELETKKFINIDFEVFRDLYNKKVNRPKTEAKRNKLKDKEREEIMLALPKYLNTITDKQYQKHPLTYLNNRSREDEIYISWPDFENLDQFHKQINTDIVPIKERFSKKYWEWRQNKYLEMKNKRKKSPLYLL